MNGRTTKVTLLVSCLLVTSPLAGCSSPQGEQQPIQAGETATPATLENLVVVVYDYHATNQTIGGFGFPGWLDSLSRYENGTLVLRHPEEVSSQSRSCLLVEERLRTEGPNPDWISQRFHCSSGGDGVIVHGVDPFGERIAFSFTGDRGTAFGGAYSWPVREGGEPTVVQIAGTSHAWTRPGNSTDPVVRYVPFAFEGTATWTAYGNVAVA